MDVLIISAVSFFASILTFYSGFGLGTLLLPVFAIWFPVEVSIGLTAVVHFLNNIFKTSFTFRHVDLKTFLNFGIPAFIFSFLGAYILASIQSNSTLYSYEFGSKTYTVTTLKFCIAVLMLFFVFFEIVPRLKNLSFDKKYLPVGGILSGFLGGLSGHQGALRSAFLVRLKLSPQSYIATGTLIACCVDISRLTLYAHFFSKSFLSQNSQILFFSTLSAFVGAFAGNKLINKITHKNIQKIVSGLLLILSIGIGLGFI